MPLSACEGAEIHLLRDSSSPQQRAIWVQFVYIDEHLLLTMNGSTQGAYIRRRCGMLPAGEKRILQTHFLSAGLAAKRNFAVYHWVLAVWWLQIELGGTVADIRSRLGRQCVDAKPLGDHEPPGFAKKIL